MVSQDSIVASFISAITTETTNLWEIDGKFSLKIVSAGNLNVSKDASVGFPLLYAHGEEICT